MPEDVEILRMRKELFAIWVAYHPNVLVRLESLGVDDPLGVAESAFDELFWNKPFGKDYDEWVTEAVTNVVIQEA